MNKHVRRISALTCALLLCLSLCGCSFWGDWDMSFFKDKIGSQGIDAPEQNGTTEYVLTGPTDFYEEPDWSAPIIATYYAGHTVVYNSVVSVDGVQWAGSNDGWFVLSGSKPDALVYTEIDKDIILTQTVDAFAEPSLDAAISSQLEVGKKVHLSQLAAAGTNPWGLCDFGWILLDDCYFDLDDLNGTVGYGVIRDIDACFYPEPNIYSGVVGTPACGSRYDLLAIVDIGGMTWCCTEAGWITTDMMYVEGTEGYRPCSAIVIDPTPLNVRLAPGTENEILTTLTYGDHVHILERINYNGSDWGFTGTGWIFMDLTEIQ